MKRLFVMLMLFAFSDLTAQSKLLNMLLIVDDAIVLPTSVSSLQLIMDDTDSVGVEYHVGYLEVVNSVIFNSLESNDKITLKFNFVHPAIDAKATSYEVDLNWNDLSQEYCILKIFNFSTRANQKKFVQKKGVGYELESPTRTLTLPRKRKKCSIW